MKKDQIILNVESPLDVSELFISRTDERGIIESGNEVFVRVSEFNREELIGSPHNIIRHPFMPKTVFRVLWNTIKAGNVIAAYVKNRSASGKYYWVLATVFPINGGYFSIRLKPTSGILKVVEEIYESVGKVEEDKGIDAALVHLNHLVKKAGFENYNLFQSHALRTELQLRDQAIVTKPTSLIIKSGPAYVRGFGEMYESVIVAANGFSETVKSLEIFDDLKAKCGSETKVIARACERLESLAVNMSISAHKLGKDGSTLAVVAASFQGTTKQIIQNYANFEKFSVEILAGLEEVLFSVSCSRVQTEMLAFFIKEIIDGISARRISSEKEVKSLVDELGIIIIAVRDLFKNSSEQQLKFYDLLLKLRKDTVELYKVLLRLDLIRTGGMLEGSRSIEISSVFKPFLNEMGELLEIVNQPVQDILASLEASVSSFEKVVSSIMQSEHVLGELEILQRNSVKLINSAEHDAA